MMKIGFFDSGIGGLTVLEAFYEKFSVYSFSKEIFEIIYLADTANLPYGDKSHEKLREILRANLNWFVGRVDLVVVACNTSAALLNESIKSDFPDLQIIDLISGFQSWFSLNKERFSRIAIFSTLATHLSGSYVQAIRTINSQAQIHSIPCPKLVPFIEKHISSQQEAFDEEAEVLIREYISELPFEPDALICGCSHYPLLKKSLQCALPNTRLINPAECLFEILNQNFSVNENTKIIAHSTGPTEHFMSQLQSLKAVLKTAEILMKSDVQKA